MMLQFKKLWLYIKKYWQVISMICGGVAAFLLLRKEDKSFQDELKKLQNSHDEELKKIQLAHDEERRQHEENVKKLQETLANVQSQYDAAKKELDDEKKKEIEELVKNYGEDPEALSQKLSEVTGFQIVLPENK